MSALVNVLQALLIIAAAPLVRGIIAKIKARLQRRQGASIWRPYADFGKLLRKENLTPPSASFLFRLAPLVVVGVTAATALLIPILRPAALLSSTGDLILLIYLLALARFFLVLGGMDGGGAFGGMGGSREVLVSAIAEVPFILSLLSVAILTQTNRLAGMMDWTLRQSFFDISPVHILACAAMALVAIAETGRMPVDNPTTHLELTMIHEAMILEHSGPSLGFLELASAIKLNVILSLLIGVFLPWGMATTFTVPAIAFALVSYAVKVAVLAALLAIVESSIAKMRMYAVPDFLGISTATSILAIVFTVLGRR